jgi:molybdenum cofactor synthesis domain-containing protein
METLNIGILTCSDRCANGLAEDASGPAIREYLEANLTKFKKLVFTSKIVPDDRVLISNTLIGWSDDEIHLILTTGGTGFAPRDVTPEATKDVLEKEAPGIVVAMLMSSLLVTPHAMLSRPAAGIRNKSLIINLPGSTKAVKENIAAIIAALPHAISLINSVPAASTVQAHQELLGAGQKPT